MRSAVWPRLPSAGALRAGLGSVTGLQDWFCHIAEAIRDLIDGANVVVNRQAAEAGLAALDAGGDSADGVIAYEGSWLGAETFVLFDKKAVRLLQGKGDAARLLA